MRIVIRCDGGGERGVGHVVRSLAVAAQARTQGHEPEIVGCFEGGFVRDLLAASGLPVRAIGRGELLGATELAGAVGEPDVLHVDNYDVESGLHAALQGSRTVLSNMADGVWGARDADLAIDHNLGAETAEPPATARWHLRGTRYAPVRESVVALREQRQTRDAPRDATPRVLVAIGGTDPREVAPLLVRALAQVGMPLRVDAIATAATRSQLEAQASGFPGELVVHDAVPDLPAMMARADLVVSAAGTSVWELCALGVPMALVAVVDNQRVGYGRVVGGGAAFGLGSADEVADIDEVAQRLRAVLLDRPGREQTGAVASRLVDGLGAWRMVSAWESVVGEGVHASQPPAATASGAQRAAYDLRLRQATLADAHQLYEWRNDPTTRAVSRDSDPIEWGSHRQWVERSIERDDRVLFIAHDSGTDTDVGTVRWDREAPGEWEVSITIAPHARGGGLARSVLKAGEDSLVQLAERPVTSVVATVNVDNTASMRLFRSSGYLPDLPPDPRGFVVLRKTIGRAQD